MSLAEDLLSQAHYLAALDKTRPKQANLRRAVSSAYYAVFHLLVSEASNKLAPASPKGLAPKLARSVTHGEIREVCESLTRINANRALVELMGALPSTDLRSIARVFAELQDRRHRADYDPAASFDRTRVEASLVQAASAFSAWKRIKNTDEATVFLTALFFAKRWSR